MKKLRFALATILAGSLAAHAISVTNGNVYTRGSGANYPDPLSGITYAGGMPITRWRTTAPMCGDSIPAQSS